MLPILWLFSVARHGEPFVSAVAPVL